MTERLGRPNGTPPQKGRKIFLPSVPRTQAFLIYAKYKS